MKGLQAILNQVEAKYSAKAKKIDFTAGDSVKVHLKVKEGEKERIQTYEGVVISRAKGGVQETFRVRRISYGIGVERMFPLNSPSIVKIDVIKRAAWQPAPSSTTSRASPARTPASPSAVRHRLDGSLSLLRPK